MADFEFIQNKVTGKWIISAPRRANRPDDIHTPNVCPFCPGNEKNEKEVYRVGGKPDDSNWQIRVVPNKYPFAPIHEIIIHSPDHHKNFGELSENQTKLVFETYRERYNTHKDQGKVYIFHNRGEQAGESLTHPHSQLAVIPKSVDLDIQPLIASELKKSIETIYYYIFCPSTSEWPDEVWLTPKSSRPEDDRPLAEKFGGATDEEISDLAQITTKLVKTFQKKYGEEFPYNFYIYPGEDWYLRFIPRKRILGGFEVGTGVSVNTQSPEDTLAFIRGHFNI